MYSSHQSWFQLALCAMCSIAVISGCGGGAPEPESAPKPALEFVNVHRFVEISGIRADGRHIQAEHNDFIGPEPYDEPGEYHATVEMGGLPFILPGYDAIAQGEIFSSETGKTFWVLAEAPKGELGTTQNIGIRTRLEQGQTFRKKADGATLKLVITEVLVELLDQNPQPLSTDDCPWIKYSTLNECSGVMVAQIDVGMHVWSPEITTGSNNLFGNDGYVELRGWRDHWDVDIDSEWYDLWTDANFEVNKDLAGDGSGSHLRVRLKEPIVVSVPLDRVPLEGNIYVNNKATAIAFNHRQRESYAAAFYRDPVRIGLSPELITDGLEQIPWNQASAPALADAAPACLSAPDPLAGTLQFERAAFDAMELPSAGARIKVTRTGGIRGDVSVQFSTADGTAVAGEDYESVNRIVVFRDGDARSKTVRVPIALDPEIEAGETVELRLSDVRGCAVIGSLSEAVLTIGDDDAPPVLPVTFTIGGSASGLVGSGLVLEDRAQFISLPIGGNGSFAFNRAYSLGASYDVHIETQPSNPAQICRVTNGVGTVSANVTNIDMTCDAPAPVPSGLDVTFGSGGKVTGGQVIRALAQQADGRLIAVSQTNITRYQSDGSIDASFGVGGIVSNPLGAAGRADIYDVAVQSDGKIIVVGDAFRDFSARFRDMAVARFNADGTRDASFNGGNALYIDFIDAPDRATRVLLQNDGRIVIAGFATTVYTSSDDDSDFAVVRLEANGAFDTAFGVGGRATADIGDPLDFANAAALQSDGKIVLAGRVSDNRVDADTGVARFNSNGTLDTTFGTQGTARYNISAYWDEASALALQADGKILLALEWAEAGNYDFAFLRLNVDGSRDASIGVNGLVTTPVGPDDDVSLAIAVQTDGKIVVAGNASTTSTPNFGVVRYMSDGTLDSTFGTAGIYTFDFFGGVDFAVDVLVQNDGRVVVGGSARNGISSVGALLRIVP